MNMKLKMAIAAAALTAGTMGLTVKAEESTFEAKADAAANSIERGAERTGAFISDAALTTKVKAKLATVEGLHDMEIKVDTDDGVVKLMGEVETEAEIAMAETAVASLEGVKGIDNQLKVDES